MKILLIYPSRLNDSGQVIQYKKAFTPPLALGIISGLTPKHHDLKVINDLVEPIDFDTPVDLVGITALTSQADRAYQIATRFREKGVKTVLGGVHPSLMPTEAGKYADTVVIG
ncbi:MAG: cobalamin-dependent protein, partial [Desulfobacterales bacterium]